MIAPSRGIATSLAHLVGAGEKRGRDIEAGRNAAKYLAARALDADLLCGIPFIVRIGSEIAKDLVIWFRSHLRRRRP